MEIKEKLRMLKRGELKAEENIKNFLKAIKKDDKAGRKINSFLQLNKNALTDAKEIDKKIKRGKAGKLAGLAIAVKSNINVKGLVASCASKTLENYEGSYDATTIEKIKAEDAIIIGITNCDEFACGSSGETSAFGPTKNPSCPDKIPGGSSSGSAAAVAAGFCDMALGSDTGGSIRNPASHCGVVGVKPSYGLASRYGLIDLSMSLDQIGCFAKNVRDAALLLSVIAGRDERDPTTFNVKIPDYLKEIDKIPRISLGISKEFEKLCQDKRIYKLVLETTKKAAKKYNWKIENISLDYIDLAVQTYYPLCYVEFFSATRKFDGRKYGYRIEEVCGPEVLRRILGGSEISKAEYHGLYYRRALKVKQLLGREFDGAFKKVDCIISPTVPKLPHKIGSRISPQEMYSYDALTIPANLAGICALSLPAGKIDGCPIGLQVMCNSFSEQKLFQIAKAIEKLGKK